MNRRFLGSILLSALFVAGALGHPANAIPEGKVTPWYIFSNKSKSPEHLVVTFVDTEGSGDKPPISTLKKYTNFSNYSALLPECAKAMGSPCLFRIEVSVDNGKTWQEPAGKLEIESKDYSKIKTTSSNSVSDTAITITKPWSFDPNLGLPTGDNMMAYSFPSASHAGGDYYLAFVKLEGKASSDFSQQIVEKMDLNIVPMKIIDAPAPNSCAVWLNYCYEEYNFPENVQFRLSVNLTFLSKKFSGWFFGHVSDSSFREVGTQSGQRVIFTAKPGVVGVIQGEIRSPYPDWVKDDFYLGRVISSKNATGNFIFKPNKANSLKFFKVWEQNLNMKQISSKTSWHIESYSKASAENKFSFVNDLNGCLSNKDGTLGFLSTNASIYEPILPRWNANEQTLEYGVASTHHDEAGRINTGTYELNIRQDIAECLWGKYGTNMKATITILSDNGTDTVSTYVVQSTNGIWKLEARNFTFSSPIIKVQLKRTEESTLIIDKPKATSSSSVTKTIPNNTKKLSSRKKYVCIRGEKIKTVYESKCPKGWKIKKS